MSDKSLRLCAAETADDAIDAAEELGGLVADIALVPIEAMVNDDPTPDLLEAIGRKVMSRTPAQRAEFASQRWTRREITKAPPIEPKREARIAAILARSIDRRRERSASPEDHASVDPRRHYDS